jgi:hypothetical protein
MSYARMKEEEQRLLETVRSLTGRERAVNERRMRCSRIGAEMSCPRASNRAGAAGV